MSDGKLSPEILLSAVQSLGKHCKSLHRTETTGTSALQRGAEPLQGHTWLPARSQDTPGTFPVDKLTLKNSALIQFRRFHHLALRSFSPPSFPGSWSTSL
ncbi:unnamed protein product [Rangifer tarandus platyrhynchus]|uniref:Uncharacterized protein n=2 Tax=Rangifer tarandus platyrhynchus TaxID=3082113 RepID=A0ABN8YJQ8_RANTA|nr:unnamed protein product [Rangifer tarandus platyrhynchus]